jgi:hypothetical protein
MYMLFRAVLHAYENLLVGFFFAKKIFEKHKHLFGSLETIGKCAVVQLNNRLPVKFKKWSGLWCCLNLKKTF